MYEKILEMTAAFIDTGFGIFTSRKIFARRQVTET